MQGLKPLSGMLTVSVCLEKETKKHRRWPIPDLHFIIKIIKNQKYLINKNGSNEFYFDMGRQLGLG